MGVVERNMFVSLALVVAVLCGFAVVESMLGVEQPTQRLTQQELQNGGLVVDATESVWAPVYRGGVQIETLRTVGMLRSATEARRSQSREILGARWEGRHDDAHLWTAFVYEETDAKDLVETEPVDFLDFCPVDNMDNGDVKNFYVYLLSSVAELESNFDPNLEYREAFNDSQGHPVISRGLLQLSFESANGYGCGFQSVQDLHDPRQNLSCGVRILDQWVSGDERIAGQVNGEWQGGARYWSVLRTSEDVEQIKRWTSNYCRQHFAPASQR